MIKYQDRFLLSSSGSTRATAYGFSNKRATLDGRTQVVWLDAVAQVCGRRLDATHQVRGLLRHDRQACLTAAGRKKAAHPRVGGDPRAGL